MLSKIGRWASGRLQGSKGVQKYDSWMQRNPWAQSALDTAGAIGVGALTGGLGGGAMLAKGAGMAANAIGRGYQPGAGGAASQGGDANARWEMEQLRGNTEREIKLQDRLQGDWDNFTPPGIENDPLDGMSFTPQGGAEIDRAVNSQWADDPAFDTTIQNDALDELRGLRNTGREFNDLEGRSGTMYNPALSGDMDGALRDSATRLMGGSGRFGPGGAPQVAGAGVTADDLRSDMSELGGFNADAAFERYATGANNRFMQALDSGFKNLRNSAAGGNRLNSGFFDLDAGDLGRTLRQDASNDISAAALQTNAQNLQAKQALTGFRVDENSAIRDARLRAGIASADNATQASIANARNALDAAGIDLDYISEGNRVAEGMSDRARDDRRFSTDRYDRQTTDLQELAELRRRAVADDSDRLRSAADLQRTDRDARYTASRDRTNRADERVRNDRTTLMDAAEARRRAFDSETDARVRAGTLRRSDRDFNEDAYRDRRDTALDWLSGRTDRLQGNENARQQRAADAAARRENNRAGAWNTGINILRTGVDLYNTVRGGRRTTG